MLFRSIAGYPPGSKFPRHASNCAFLSTLEQQSDAPFLKTHAVAPQELSSEVRAIFIFGDPVAAVWSTWKKCYHRDMFRQCGYEGEAPDILNCDELGYERIFDSWMKPHSYPLLTVRYETLWHRKDIVEEFIGRPILMPEFRSRRSDIPQETERHLRRVYARLDDKVRNAPDIAVWPTTGSDG
jgi:hypothetical protein